MLLTDTNASPMSMLNNSFQQMFGSAFASIQNANDSALSEAIGSTQQTTQLQDAAPGGAGASGKSGGDSGGGSSLSLDDVMKFIGGLGG